MLVRRCLFKSGQVFCQIQRSLSSMGNFTSTSDGQSSTSYSQFIQTTCPYCVMAKDVFNKLGATYKAIELDIHDGGQQLQEALAQISGARTVPRVFINGQCIGGGSDTRQLHEEGKLLPLIQKCNPCCINNVEEGSGSGQSPSN